MKVLVINCGSSSLKFQLIDMENDEVLAKGLCERIGMDGHVKYEGNGQKVDFEIALKDHVAAFEEVKKLLTEGETKVADPEDIGAIGHRVVQGGDKFKASVLIDEEVKQGIDELSPLAPLHNPANLQGICAAEEAFAGVPQVAVFDNAFHSTMPEQAYMYALPYDVYEKYKVRRYGFHGTSHRYVYETLHEAHPEYNKVITCHLGNGSSLAAILDGRVMDTSMGMTPLSGFSMGTRSGDFDPAIIPFLQKQEDLSAEEIDDMINKKSGFLGISGVSSDFRDVEEAALDGHRRAALSMHIFNYQVAKFIASYTVPLQGVDAIVFTAGIGENSATARGGICAQLDYMGVKVDYDRNHNAPRGEVVKISAEDSKVDVYVIPTNEELAIALDTYEITSKLAERT